MNQQCKVCGEPAAGFHFGAFTCEGCKSFFGRSYNNLTTINDCKNNGKCIINKKNRTSCKACRLNKCLKVGMSKSGSRYGRRSNWFKIHCLLQEQQQNANLNLASFQLPTPSQTRFNNTSSSNSNTSSSNRNRLSPSANNNNNNSSNSNGQSATSSSQHHHLQMAQLHPNPSLSPLTSLNHFPPTFLNLPRIKEELMLLNIDEVNRNSTVSPSISSPESHHSDSSSVEESLAASKRSSMNPNTTIPPLFSNLFTPAAFLPPPNFLFQAGFPAFYPNLMQQAVTNNNNKFMRNHNMNFNNHINYSGLDKRLFLDAILQSQKSPEQHRANSTGVNDDDDNNNKPKQVPTTITKYTKDDKIVDIMTTSITTMTTPTGNFKRKIDDDGDDDVDEDDDDNDDNDEHPIDLSMKSSIGGGSERELTPADSVRSRNNSPNYMNSDSESEQDLDVKKIKLERRPTPLDLTTKV